MARGTNTFSLGAGFNITGQEPIDSRLVVSALSDLTTPETWNGVGLYNGLVVAVTESSSLYVLNNRDDVTNPESWTAVGGDVTADLGEIKSDIQGLKDSKQDKVIAGNGINLNEDGKTLSIKIDPASQGLTVGPDGLKATVPAVPEYALAVSSETTAGYLKSYELQKDGVAVGVKIDIPKDLVVTSGEVKTVETPDDPYSGAIVGDLYLQLVIANQATPIYIPVKSLTDVYVGSTYITVEDGTISVKYDALKNQINTDLVAPLNGKVTTLEATVGGAESGLVKDVSDIKTSLEGLTTNLDEKLNKTATVNGQSFVSDALTINATHINIASKIGDNEIGTSIENTLINLNNKITSAVSGGLTNIVAGNGTTVTGVVDNSQTVSILKDPKENNKIEVTSTGVFVPDMTCYWEELN